VFTFRQRLNVVCPLQPIQSVYLNSQERLLAFGLMGLAGLFFSSAVILDVIRRHQDDGAS